MITEQMITEQVKTHTTCGKEFDDMGNHWYDYSQYATVEVGVKFNVIKLDGGMIQYNIKDESNNVHQFVAPNDKGYTYNQNFNTSGIPSLMRDKYLKDFDITVYSNEQLLAKEAGKRAKNYIKNFKEIGKEGIGLFIHSKAESSGKTYLAAIIANELMKRYDANIKFVKAVNFFSELKRNIGNNSDPYARSSALDSAIKSGILVIDDLGAGQQSDYISDLIYEIVSKRVNDNKVTIFTSKRSLGDLKYYDRSTLMLIDEKCLKIILPNVNAGKDIVKEKNRKYEELLNA